MQETWVQFLDWEDTLEKEMATTVCVNMSVQALYWSDTIYLPFNNYQTVYPSGCNIWHVPQQCRNVALHLLELGVVSSCL